MYLVGVHKLRFLQAFYDGSTIEAVAYAIGRQLSSFPPAGLGWNIMGISLPSFELLCCAKSMGVDFSDTMMIGRQTINEPPARLAPLLLPLGLPHEGISNLSRGDYAEPLFRLLGAKTIRSLDVSDYEHATNIHDLNQPLPAKLKKRFSVVFDGGTIEHVFNAAQAIKNVAEMVRIGGHMIQVTVANNLMGHGFWQLSPELIYRFFAGENGFSLRCVFLHEMVPGGCWYKVIDPALCGSRVQLCNSKPTYLCSIAQRISSVSAPIWEVRQSDYVSHWHGTVIARQATKNVMPSFFKRIMRSLRMAVNRRGSRAFRQPYYTRIASKDIRAGVF
jgi:hypothetical protein